MEHYTLNYPLNRYSLSINGEIINNETGKILKNIIDNNGYQKINLSIKQKRYTMYLHRLLGKYFIPNPENKPDINHKNGIKGDNRLENLEWVTKKENVIHAYSNNLISKEKQRKMRNGSVIVLDTYNGIYYDSMKDLAKCLNIDPDTLTNRIKSNNKNYKNRFYFEPKSKRINSHLA